LGSFVIHRKLLRRRHVRKLQIKKEREAKARLAAAESARRSRMMITNNNNGSAAPSDIFRGRSTSSSSSSGGVPVLALSDSFSDLVLAKSVDDNDETTATVTQQHKRIKLAPSPVNAMFETPTAITDNDEATTLTMGYRVMILPQKLPLDFSPVRSRPQRISLRPALGPVA
jgi:hypothetical protein